MASLNPFTGTLGQRRAAHLLRRTSYRFTKARVDQLATQTVDQALASLLTVQPLQLDQPIWGDTLSPTTTTATWINPAVPILPLPDSDFNLQRRVLSWWLNEALLNNGIGHKMAFFLHQFQPVTYLTSKSTVFYDYLSLLRWGSLGNFKKLITKMVVDNTMLRYLNNSQNSKYNPNENFAREFLELFTIGKGPQIGPGDYTTYTEDDVVQAARVLTGFTERTQRDMTDPETGVPRGTVTFSRHDTGSKTFSSKFQNTVIPGATNAAGVYTELDTFITMVFAQPETAKNFCRRLYRHFISRNITAEIETDIIAPLATTFINNNFEILPVLRQLLKSQHFFDLDDSDNTNEIVGAMIRSPLELALQSLSFFNVAIPSVATENNKHHNNFYSSGVMERMLGYANMVLFYPPDVAGYPAYHQAPEFNRHWFNSSSIIARYKLPAMLLTGKRQIGSSPNSSIAIKLSIASWVKTSGICADPADAFVLVHSLIDYMLPNQPDADRFDYFFTQIFLDNLPAADWTYEWENYLTSNNDAEIKIPLERLVNYLMFSPEYQTF